jgi:5-methylcytosine-specific restriction protein A
MEMGMVVSVRQALMVDRSSRRWRRRPAGFIPARGVGVRAACRLWRAAMPSAPKYPCRKGGCGVLVPGGGWCEAHKAERWARADRNRGTAHERGYGARWRKARKAFIAAHPICNHPGCEQPASVVDHIVPHRGDPRLFWDATNWQGLCKPHHDAKTAREDGGFGNRRR